MKYCIVLLLTCCFVSCTPIKSSSKDEKMQTELTLQEVRTDIDDLRHDLNCFKTDIQIVESKLQVQENQIDGFQQKQISQTLAKMNGISEKMSLLEDKIMTLENERKEILEDVDKLSFYAKETTASLTQYKNKISELENLAVLQKKHFEEMKRLKKALEEVVVSLQKDNEKIFFYKVKAGDSLERIAKVHKTTVDHLKKINGLQQDLIVIGQEIKIPK